MRWEWKNPHLWNIAFLYPCGLEFTLTKESVTLPVQVRALSKQAPEFSRAQLSKVFSGPVEPNDFDDQLTDLDETRRTHLGTMSLKSSILSRPAGVSPMLMSMKTMGRVTVGVADMEVRADYVSRDLRFRHGLRATYAFGTSSNSLSLASNR